MAVTYLLFLPPTSSPSKALASLADNNAFSRRLFFFLACLFNEGTVSAGAGSFAAGDGSFAAGAGSPEVVVVVDGVLVANDVDSVSIESQSFVVT